MMPSSRLIHGVDVAAVALAAAREACDWRGTDLAGGQCPDHGVWMSTSSSKAASEFELAEVRVIGKGVQVWVQEPHIRDQWIAWYAYWRRVGWENQNLDALPADCPPPAEKRKHTGKPDIAYSWAALGQMHRADLEHETAPVQLDIFGALAA